MSKAIKKSNIFAKSNNLITETLWFLKLEKKNMNKNKIEVKLQNELINKILFSFILLYKNKINNPDNNGQKIIAIPLKLNIDR